MLVTELIVPFLFVLITVGFCTLCTCCIKSAGRTRTLGVIMGVPLQTNAESQLRNGMDPDMISAFPIVAYSEIKHMKVGKGLLECAICISEFGDVDSVRLLPKCDHAFHPECIDTWLSSHVTCPVCRINLVGENEKAIQSSESMGAEQAFNQDNNHVAVSIDEAGGRGTHRLITDHAQARSLCSHSRRIGLMSS